MFRREFLTTLGVGAAAGMIPARALADAPEDVTQPIGRFRSLFGTREFFVGETLEKLPRARSAVEPLARETRDAFLADLATRIPVPASTGPHVEAVASAARRLDPMARMRLVNDFTNRMPYVEDSDNFGMRDFWADTPTFFNVGGDCEDFALAKYKLLHELGFHATRLRIVVLLDTERNRQHAVLAVDTGDRAWMLDSLIRDVVPHETAPHYRPTISLSGPRLYLHVESKA